MITGKLLDVSTYPAGSAVSDTPTAGRLPVYEVWDFPADGGAVAIGGVTYPYDSIDPETSELVGGSLPAPAIDTDVLVAPYSETKYALVDLGEADGGVQALIPHALSALLEDGQRDPDNAETVTIRQTSLGSWQIEDVLDRPALLTPEAGSDLPPDPASDGVPPETSPDPTATGGVGSTFLRWAPIENADPVTYQVHVATFPDFIPDGTTLTALTPASSINIKTLPDDSPLLYDTPYYWRIVATDADGEAPPSGVASAQLFKVSGPDIAADYVYAGNILVNQLLTGELQADVTLSGSIKTAASGARVEMSAFGIVQYDSTGTPTTLLGNDGLATFKGQVQATTLSVTGGMSIRGTANELAQAGSLTLAAGVSAAANAPTVVTDYETLAGWKSGNGNPWPAGYEFKNMQRIGTKWLAGAREVATDTFFGRTWNDDGTFDNYYGVGWVGQQIQRCALVDTNHPLYAFRGTDRRIVAARHSVGAGAIVNSLSWDFATNTQPAGSSETGTVSYSSGSVKIDANSVVQDSSLEQSAGVDFRGRRLTVKVVPSGSVNAAGQVVEVRMRNATAGEYILARFEGETGLTKVKFQTYNGSPGSTKTAIATVFAGYNYWRLSESNGDALLQVSTDGSSWSNAATITDHGLTDTDLSAMALGLIVRAGDGGEATSSRFDDVTLGYGFVDYGDTITWADTLNPPGLGTDGTNLLAAEVNSSGALKLYEIDPRSPGRVVTTYTASANAAYPAGTILVSVAKGSFDFGGTRFVITTGNAGTQKALVFTVSGTTLTYAPTESFWVPGQAGTGYDGTQFQTLAVDGVRRKHTTITWTDTSAYEKTWYAATTWYDGDATGGTHETTPSPRAAFSFKKRQRYTVTSGDIPDLGGTDDPDRIRIYLASGLATTLYRQATTAAGINSAVFTTATFSGTSAPVSNDFPTAIAALIKNVSSSLRVSGDGTIKGTTIEATTELKTPLLTSTGPVSATRLAATAHAFGETPLASAYTVTTSNADVPGLSTTATVGATTDRFLVFVILDVDTTASTTPTTLTCRLVVDGTTQTRQINMRLPTPSGLRDPTLMVFPVTGVAAGAGKIFKVQAVAPTGTTYRINSVHSAISVVQIP